MSIVYIGKGIKRKRSITYNFKTLFHTQEGHDIETYRMIYTIEHYFNVLHTCI